MNLSLKILAAVAALALPLASYSADSDAGKPAAPAAPTQVAPTPAPIPTPVTGKDADKAPEKASEKPIPLSDTISGKVLQTMASGGYSYVYVEDKDQKVWVAVPEMKVKVGDQVSFKSGMVMSNFPSSTLKRTFDRIVFSEGVISSSGGKSENTSPGASGAMVSSKETGKIAKATGPNAYTVAELFAKSAKLHKKKVVVHGRVVKVSSNIMKRNWIHIQDGTGSAKKENHNLVVTSDATPTVGDIVTVTGTLFKDKDFGGNYKYKVIVEDATVAQ